MSVFCQNHFYNIKLHFDLSFAGLCMCMRACESVFVCVHPCVCEFKIVFKLL